MKIACVYTIEAYNSIEKPIGPATAIPFGISLIATVLKDAGHDVELFVLTPDTPLDEYIGKYIENEEPSLFCFTAVSSQYEAIKKVANYVRKADEDIFCLLGGHHSSLNSEDVINHDIFDAICVGEGEKAVVAFANQLESGLSYSEYKIPNLIFKDRANNKVHKNPTGTFNQNLDDLPFLDRSLWDKWVQHPSDYPAILLGRGCPFKCTYCSNHAMAKLATGTYVRFRSPQDIIEEIDYIKGEYPDVERIYLEVETFGANRKASYAVFDAIAEYNNNLEEPLTFGVNMALSSNYMVHPQRRKELFSKVNAANIKTINIGLETGSERMRKSLARPKYTNEEIIAFCQDAKKHNIRIIFYILFGLPNETIEDYFETVRVARAAQPYYCYVSIFFPYLGTDLADRAIHMGLVEPDNISLTSERNRSVLELPGFSKRRIRFEYIVFMWRVYKGYWPFSKIAVNVLSHFLRAYPKIYSLYFFLSNNFKIVRDISNKFNVYERKFTSKKLPKTMATREDFVRD